MNADKRLRLQVRYASQTSTAFQIGLEFCQYFAQYVQTYKPLQLQQGQQYVRFQSNQNSEQRVVYVFIIATTGYGDPPYTMKALWKSLLSKNFNNCLQNITKTPLKNMQFAIYGLGDRSYGDNYNITSRKLRQRLLMLGATQIFQIGLGDQQDRAGNYQQFRNYFIPQIHSFIAQNSLQAINTTPKQIQKKIKQFAYYKYQMSSKKQLQKLQKLHLKGSKLLSHVNDREIHWIQMEYFSDQSSIVIGDTLNIYPENDQQIVSKMCNYFLSNDLNDLNLDKQQLQYYLRHGANLSNILNFSFFSKNPLPLPNNQLHDYINIPANSQKVEQIHNLIRQKLIELQTDFNEYYHYIKKYRRNICEVITDFSLKIPISQFIRRIGRIIPRKYSIAYLNQEKNYQKQQNKEYQYVYKIGLLIKLEKTEAFGNRIIEGLCSKDLINSSKNKSKSFRYGNILKNGEFRYPQKPSVFISLGTGIAPFLAIFFRFKESLKSTPQYLNKFLIYHSYKYHLQLPFREMLFSLSQQNFLKQSITYTREQTLPKTQKTPNIQEIIKIRIQKIIQEDKQLKQIQQTLQKNGSINICGNKQFIEYVFSILKRKLSLNIPNLRKKKQLFIENW